MSDPYSEFHLQNWTDSDFAKHAEATRETIRRMLDLETRLKRREAETTNLLHDNVKLRSAIHRAIPIIEDGVRFPGLASSGYQLQTLVDDLFQALGTQTKKLEDMCPEDYALYFD